MIARYRALLPKKMGLVVGVRASATDPAMTMVRRARELGADAILLGPHSVQKDAPLLEYYHQVSDAAQIRDTATRKVLIDGAKGEFALVGRQAGIALSRFALSEEWKIVNRLARRRRRPSAPRNKSTWRSTSWSRRTSTRLFPCAKRKC